MKRMKTTLWIYATATALALSLSACSDSDEPIDQNSNALEETTELLASAEIDEMDAVLADLVIDVFDNYDENEAGRYAQPVSYTHL